jgi:hypothetical protein
MKVNYLDKFPQHFVFNSHALQQSAVTTSALDVEAAKIGYPWISRMKVESILKREGWADYELENADCLKR